MEENKPAGWQGALRQEWSQQPRVAFKLQHFVSNPPLSLNVPLCKMETSTAPWYRQEDLR